MEIKDRVMLVRQQAGLSQRAFAERIGVSYGVIANIEYNKAPMTRVVGIAICSKFNIREEWLFHGEGDMSAPDDLVEQLCVRRNLNDAQRAILMAAADMGPDAADLLVRVAEKIVSGVPSQDAVPTLRASDLPPYVPLESQNEKKSG